MMNVIAIIPARMASRRFPNKPMANILSMPMIGHVYNRSRMCTSLIDVYVATCDKEIFDYIESIGGDAIITADTHERASDRVAEALLIIPRFIIELQNPSALGISPSKGEHKSSKQVECQQECRELLCI